MQDRHFPGAIAGRYRLTGMVSPSKACTFSIETVTGAELRVDGGLLAGVALRAPGEEG